MKLWILRPNWSREVARELWASEHDKALGFVVCAETEDRARRIAYDNAGDEGGDVWLDSVYTTCAELETEDVREELLMRDMGPITY